LSLLLKDRLPCCKNQPGDSSVPQRRGKPWTVLFAALGLFRLLFFPPPGFEKFIDGLVLGDPPCPRPRLARLHEHLAALFSTSSPPVLISWSSVPLTWEIFPGEGHFVLPWPGKRGATRAVFLCSRVSLFAQVSLLFTHPSQMLRLCGRMFCGQHSRGAP